MFCNIYVALREEQYIIAPEMCCLIEVGYKHGGNRIVYGIFVINALKPWPSISPPDSFPSVTSETVHKQMLPALN